MYDYVYAYSSYEDNNDTAYIQAKKRKYTYPYIT